MDLEKLQTEARAKIFWGDLPEEVLRFLRAGGMEEGDARAFIDLLKQERAAHVRAEAVSKMVTGSLMVTYPVVAYYVFVLFHIISMKLWVLTVAVACYGFWRAIGGLINLVAPHFGNEDLSE